MNDDQVRLNQIVTALVEWVEAIHESLRSSLPAHESEVLFEQTLNCRFVLEQLRVEPTPYRGTDL